MFFRIKAANRDRSGALADEEEDEEELLWESEDAKEEASNKYIEENSKSSFGMADTSTSKSSSSDVVSQLRKQNKELQDDNAKLQGQVRSLVSRIAQLEEINSRLLGAQGSGPNLITTSSTTDKSNNESNSNNNITNKMVAGNSATEFSETLSTSSDGSAVMINSSSFGINNNIKEGRGASTSPDSKHNPLYNTSSPITASAASDLDAHIPIGRTPVQSSIPLAGLDEEEDDEWN